MARFDGNELRRNSHPVPGPAHTAFDQILTGPFLPPSHALAGGVPAALVAAGEYELAIAPLTTVIATPGVGPAAVFPEHLGTHIDMSIFRNAVSPIAAETVIDILTGHGFDDELAAAGIARFELT